MGLSPARFGLLALIVGFVSMMTAQRLRTVSAPAPAAPTSYRGGLVAPPLPKPRFVLTDTSGTPFDFWSETQGVVTLLFFGYMNCPDECLLHLDNIKLGLDSLPVTVRDQVRVIFITTDPGRDGPRMLRSWLDRFDERFIGLTGIEADIETAQRAAGVPITKRAVSAGGTYSVGYATFVVVYTKDNLAHVVYPVGMVPQDWAHDLPLLVTEDWVGH